MIMDNLTLGLVILGGVLLVLYMMKRRSRLSKDLD
jgi:hypothetical protein